MDMQAAIRAVTERRDLSAEEMTAVMREKNMMDSIKLLKKL